MANLDWDKIEKDYQSFSEKLSTANLDPKTRAELQKKSSHYSDLLFLHEKIENLEQTIIDLRQLLLIEKDSSMSELYKDEIEQNQNLLEKLNNELQETLYPKDERDERSVFLEIRAGAGGQEAALFASDLFKMYSAYALNKNWVVSIIDYNQTGIGGFKELIAYIKGRDVYKYLKFESGVHRVQRVPETEGSGRIHTSTITVAVLPETEEVEININPQDLRVDVYRSSGAGGQHVNTTDSAVRITHLPTGLVVACQDERSQIKNKAKALKVLQARLYQLEKDKQQAEISAQRKQQVGMGERAEKIRTYNFPQNRVTDHRVEVTLKKLDLVMQGDLDDLLEPLIKWDLENRKKEASLFFD